MHPSGSGMGEIPNDSLDDQAVRTPLGRALQIASSFCRLGDAEGAVAAFEHARGIGALSPADATTVNYLLNALSRDSEKAFER